MRHSVTKLMKAASVGGACRRDRLTEALGALNVSLSAEQLAALERAIPADAAAGGRYPEPQLVHMDSERPNA